MIAESFTLSNLAEINSFSKTDSSVIEIKELERIYIKHREYKPEMYMIPVFANSEYLGYTTMISGKTDRDFLLAEINNLVSDENAQPIESECIVLYVDNVPYCFFRD